MAHVAGVAHLDEKCHLSIHPKHGPWIALRAVLVFDDIEGPDEADRQTTPPNPLATNGAARARVDDAFAYALEGYADPSLSAERWRRWVAVRDAVFFDPTDDTKKHPERYYDEQVLYHYNCQTGGDARKRIRERLRAYAATRENKSESR
jgi:methylmalonic aciduria homocystinuria type C protein